MADLAETLSFQLRVANITLIPGRKFRTDILVGRLAIEVDGATWIGGRHARGYGIEEDCVKQNTLVTLGYRPMRFTSKQVKDGRALRWIEQALNMGGQL